MMGARTIGKYRFVEKVGRGGMGTVYRAVDETLERDVAIKVLNSEITEPEVLKRFRAEALMLARLSHPAIAVVYDLQQQDGDVFMVMEFVRGETFQQLSERCGQLPLDQTVALATQALDALAYAHRLGIVHRDLKPSNLMLSDTGQVKVMDFGIARIVGSEHLTGDGSMMGTPAYMAPEQVRGDECDGRADLYSMAVVLYRLLAAKLPFEADTAIAFAQKQLYDPPTPITDVRPDLPTQCEAVLARALEKSARDRFQTAEEFKDALVASLGPSLATPLALAGLAGDAMTCTVPTPVGTLRQAALAPATQNAKVEPETRRTSTPLESTAQSTVVISSRYFVAGTATIALLLVALLAAVVIVARRPLGLPTAEQIAARIASVAEKSPAPAATQETPRSTQPAPSQPVPAPPAPPSQARGDNPLPKPATVTPRTSPTNPQASTAAAKTAVPPPTPPSEPTPAPTAGAKPAAPTVPTVSFDHMKLLVIDGNRSREQDARIHLADGRILIIAVGDRLVASIPFTDVVTLSSSRSKQPRWRNADGTEGTADLKGGAFGFLKSDRTWMAIQTHDHTYVIRADRDDIEPLTRAASERTGVAVTKVESK